MLMLLVHISQFEYQAIIIFSYMLSHFTNTDEYVYAPYPHKENRKPVAIMEVLNVDILIWLDKEILSGDIWSFLIGVMILFRYPKGNIFTHFFSGKKGMLCPDTPVLFHLWASDLSAGPSWPEEGISASLETAGCLCL